MNGQNLQGVIKFANVAFTGRAIPFFYHTFEAVQIISKGKVKSLHLQRGKNNDILTFFNSDYLKS